MTDISKFPVMKSHCLTCPFRRDENGRQRDSLLANRVRANLLQASQICHHPRLENKPETHLCRGARDEQLQLMFRLGVIAEPTDDAWQAAREKLGVA